MNEQRRERIDAMGVAWGYATPDGRFEIESELRSIGCQVSITEAGNLHVVDPAPSGFLDESAPVDWEKITSVLMLKTLREAIQHGEQPVVMYATWGMVDRVWQPIQVRAIAVKVGEKRVRIRLDPGVEQWCEPRNLSIVKAGGEVES